MKIKGIFRFCTLTCRKQKKQKKNFRRVFNENYTNIAKKSTNESEEKMVILINIFAPIILAQQWQHLLLMLQKNMIFASTLRFSSRSPQSEINIDIATFYYIWASASRHRHFSSVPKHSGNGLHPLFHTSQRLFSIWYLTGCRRTVWLLLKNVWQYK